MIQKIKINLLKLAVLFGLLVIIQPNSMAQNSGDWRNIENALSVIPDENYADQPYLIAAKNGDWVSVITTGPGHESQEGQHLVTSISTDQGKTWSGLIDIEKTEDPPSSWGIPYVTSYGRIYVFYTFNGDNINSFPDGKPINHNTELGWYCFKYSDDHGRTWSDRYRIPMRKTTVDFLNPWNGQVQLFWGISKPFLHENSMYFSFTKMGIHPQDMGEGFLYKSDNINTERDPLKINWELLPEGNTGISYTPMGKTQEEHNVVPLNNGDLYCMYRTSEGYPAYSISSDYGKTWSTPQYATYEDGRVIKTPRACPRVFKTKNGKYLLWFHNNNIKGYKGHRNPVWVSGGIEEDGEIRWSQPEILLYTTEGEFGMSYPDMIEEDGQYWVTETQKTVARIHQIDNEFLYALWDQGNSNTTTSKGLIVERIDITANDVIQSIHLPNLKDGGFTVELLLELDGLIPGQVLLDNFADNGDGMVIRVTPQRTLELVLTSGELISSLETDPGVLDQGQNHVVFVVDGRANLLTSIVNGRVCDGGRYKFEGWSWINSEINQVNGTGDLRMAPSFGGEIRKLRIYDRYLTSSEAICNYLSEISN